MEAEGTLEVKEGSPCLDGEGEFQEVELIVLWLHKMLLMMQFGLVSTIVLRIGRKEGRWVLVCKLKIGATLGKDFVLVVTLNADVKVIVIEPSGIENKVGLVVRETLSA